jgi:hypothetical protein
MHAGTRGTGTQYALVRTEDGRKLTTASMVYTVYKHVTTSHTIFIEGGVEQKISPQ